MPLTFDERLRRAHLRLIRTGCDTCRSWTGHQLVTVDETTGIEAVDRPETCPNCGREVPVFRQIRIVAERPHMEVRGA